MLEDADCLVFLETKLTDYLDEWEEEKTIHILQRTLKKMTPQARTNALQLKLGLREGKILQKAIEAANV